METAIATTSTAVVILSAELQLSQPGQPRLIATPGRSSIGRLLLRKRAIIPVDTVNDAVEANSKPGDAPRRASDKETANRKMIVRPSARLRAVLSSGLRRSRR